MSKLAEIYRRELPSLSLHPATLLTGEQSPKPPLDTHNCSTSQEIELVRPNKSLWLLPNGRIVDVQLEGSTDNGSAFSHGLYVKHWVSFRLKDFHPDTNEVSQAEVVRARAQELISQDPSLDQPFDNGGHRNYYAGDLAYNQAAQEELGWIRIKPVTNPIENEVFFETADGKLTAQQEQVLGAVQGMGYKVMVLKGGALNNRPGLHGGTIRREQH